MVECLCIKSAIFHQLFCFCHVLYFSGIEILIRISKAQELQHRWRSGESISNQNWKTYVYKRC